jgi:AraC-like DNA-binding protein
LNFYIQNYILKSTKHKIIGAQTLSFDIGKYCHINHSLTVTGSKKGEFNHSGINLLYVQRGGCNVRCSNSEFYLKKYDVICCADMLKYSTEKDTIIYGVNIGGIIADRYAKDVGTAFVTGSVFVPFLPNQISQVAKNYDALSENYLINVSFEMLNALSRSDRTAVIANETVVKAIKLINENYQNSYGVEELASDLNISKSHLVREFCKNTGTTPGKYLGIVRINAVKQLLVETSLSLNEIAALTGFSGDNYLCKAFKRSTGETPMEYKDRVISSQYLPNQLTLQTEPEIFID